MKTCAIASVLLALGAGAALAFPACSSALAPARVPSAPPAAAPLAPAPAGLLSAAGATTLAESEDLAGFVPFLSMPELSAAAQAYATDDYATAATLVEEHLKRTELGILEEPRWYLLLGSLREKGGDLLGASDAYERASQSPWPLWDYARLGRGRALFGLQDWENAESALGGVPENSGVYATARGLLAESACQQGAVHECVERASAFKALTHKPLSWATQALRIAEALVNQLATPGATPTTSAMSAGGAAATPATPSVEDQLATLAYLRSLILDAPKTASRFDALALERRLLEVLPEPARARAQRLSSKEQLARAEAMEGAGRAEDAHQMTEALLSELGAASFDGLACQARLVQCKALLDQKQRTRAFSRLNEIVSHCKSDELRASALYLSGRAAFQEEKYPEADRLLARLEREAPHHRLADDARLYRAQAQHELGDDARFTELLERMPSDYPDGDMVEDGLFLLAVTRMEKADWAGAEHALERSLQLSNRDPENKAESSGRERYFQARAMIETGAVEPGLAAYEQLIAELPLSYYMLNAYSRLAERDPARAQRALATALGASEPPFRIEHRPEFDQPGFLRALELFRQGDIDSARRELELANLLQPGASPAVLWGVSLLYARAGSARLSHAVPRWQLHDWTERWPVGAWRQAWELAFPRPHIEAVSEAARRQGIEPALIYAVMREESAFDADAVSPANAYGLMQIISPTARRFGKELGMPYDRHALTTPRVNIAVGSRVLANYQSYFPNDPLLAIPGYNAGPGKPKRWARDWPSVDFDLWVELIPYRETRRYTKRVLASRAAYAFLYYQNPETDPLRLPRRLSASATN